MQEEIWKDIPGLFGFYQISNYGRMRSVDRVIERGSLHPNIQKGRIMKYLTNRDGYVYGRPVINKKKTMVFPHRLVATLFVENINNKPEVNHKDGNKSNNIYSNLEWATRKENMEHAVRNGLHNLNGENHSSSKLKNSQVVLLRQLYNEKKATKAELARKYGITWNTVDGIIKRKYWKHI